MERARHRESGRPRTRAQTACRSAVSIVAVGLFIVGCDSVSAFLSTDPVTYTVGGELEGLADGATLVLGNNDERLTLTQDGAFAFAERHESGTPYEVFVAEQPDGQRCEVGGAAGTIGSDDVRDIRVDCRAVLNVSWAPSRHSSVHQPGGGYTLYFAREAGFHPEDAGVRTLDVHHDPDHGETPASTPVAGLEPGTWYFRVRAFSSLGRSALSPESSFVLEEGTP